MLKGLIEAYVTALLESDETLQNEFAAMASGAVQGVTAPAGGDGLYVKRRRKRRKTKP